MGAELNAFTSKEYTCYYSRFVDEHLDRRSRSSRTWSSTPTSTTPSCESEREVVIEEIARMEDTPDDHIHEIFSNALWPDHPIGLPILGSRETRRRLRPRAVGRLPRAALPDRQLRRRCRRQRRPRRARRAGRGPARRTLPHGPALGASGRARGRAARASRSFEKETEQAHICFGVSTMNAHHPDRFALVARSTGCSAAAWRRGCSRRSARSAAWRTRSTASRRSTRTPASSPSTRARVPSTPRRSSGSSAPRSSVSRSTASRPRSSTACGRPRRATSCSGWSPRATA